MYENIEKNKPLQMLLVNLFIFIFEQFSGKSSIIAEIRI